MEDKMRFFGKYIDKIINRENLTRDEAKEMFRQILMNEQPDLQQGAFLSAITSKGATPQEIAGGWEMIYNIDTVKVSPNVNGPLVENCGTGMDSFKTFNISTAASIIAAADGVYMAKHGARAITSRCGTVDLLEAVGIDVNCSAEIVKKSIEAVNIGIFNGMSDKIHPCALGRILSQVRFGTILNIAASLANPASPAIGVRGVYNKEMIIPTLETMKEIGYQKALVFHGRNKDDSCGMDEFSVSGKTYVAEMKNDSIEEYIFDPQDLGIESFDERDIIASDRETETKRFLKLMEGGDDGSRADIVCLNAAAILYICGHVSDIKDGFEQSRSVLASGRALSKVKDWVSAQNTEPPAGIEKLDALLSAFC